MTRKRRVLVVEDDRAMRELLDDELRAAGYDVVMAADGLGALARLEAGGVDAVVTDHMMPGLRGRELLDRIRAREPGLPVIIITAFGTIDAAVDAMRAGATHYLPKPFGIEQLLGVIEGATRPESPPEPEAAGTIATGVGGPLIVAGSAAMRACVELTLRAAPADAPVLVLGESGTGKELLARALHSASPRRARPFVAINCSAIPEHLLESQLFGHRRGAFTDARDDQPGLFRTADGGTLLLDEIGDMAHALQAKLLRVLQEREIHPIGAAVPVPVDVRIVAATHADLDRMVAEGRFRKDLFYRLNVISVRVPPLRERPEDLELLVRHFLAKHAPRSGRPTPGVEATAMDLLRAYDWPGNVRELENAIERALVLGGGTSIRVADLPPALHAPSMPVGQAGGAATAGPSLADMERDHILGTLRAVGGNRAAAARLLNVDRKTLYRKLKQYGAAAD